MAMVADCDTNCAVCDTQDGCKSCNTGFFLDGQTCKSELIIWETIDGPIIIISFTKNSYKNAPLKFTFPELRLTLFCKDNATGSVLEKYLLWWSHVQKYCVSPATLLLFSYHRLSVPL